MMAGNNSSKADYEPIPDVENGIGATQNDDDKTSEYLDLGLDGDQTKLLLSLDSAIASSTLDLQIPSVNPSDLARKGKSFISGLISPTIAAACTFCTALYLQKQSQANSLFENFLVPWFPYINATILFVTTAWPIQERLMDAIEPLFKKSNDLQNQFQDTVKDIAPKVDETVDSIQAQVRTVLEPMEPTLQQANSQTAVLKKLDPRLEIPDTDDLDREFDDMQGVMGDKIDEAAANLKLQQYIPVYLQSHKKFYWYIVVPVLAVAFLLQLGLAYTSQHHGGYTRDGINNATSLELPMPQNRHYLRGLRTLQQDQQQLTDQFNSTASELQENTDAAVDDYKNQLNSTTAEYKDQLDSTTTEYKDQVDTATTEYKDQFDSTVNDYKGQLNSTVDGYKDQLNSTVSDYKDQLNSTVSDYKDQLDATTTEYKDKVDSTVNEYKDKANEYKKQFDDTTNEYKDKANQYKKQLDDTTNEYKNKLNSTLNGYKDQLNATDYQQQFDDAVAHSKSLVKNVVSSYIMSFLQLALVYLLTNDRIKAWIVNKMVSKMQDEAMRTLRQYGVTTAMEDVMGTKMGLVRTKVLTILKLYAKVQGLLDKIPGVGAVSEQLSSLTGGKVSAADISDKVSGMSGKFSSFTKGFK